MGTVCLDFGADIDAVDAEYSSTPLGWAARAGQEEMVDWLLKKGANPNRPEAEPWRFRLHGRRGADTTKSSKTYGDSRRAPPVDLRSWREEIGLAWVPCLSMCFHQSLGRGISSGIFRESGASPRIIRVAAPVSFRYQSFGNPS